MAKDYDYSFSSSKLGTMQCPKCFYAAEKFGIAQPRGIFPGLPGGVDRVMKIVRDAKRPELPSDLVGKIDGKFYGDTAYINKLRNWQSGLKAMLTIRGKRVRVIGALDDLIEELAGFSPYDDKTKGDLPKDDGAQYYLQQLDLYSLLLKENKMQPSGKAYLNYHYPVAMDGDDIVFAHVLYTLEANWMRAITAIEKAVDLLEGPEPKAAPSCEFCRFAEAHFQRMIKPLAELAAM